MLNLPFLPLYLELAALVVIVLVVRYVLAIAWYEITWAMESRTLERRNREKLLHLPALVDATREALRKREMQGLAAEVAWSALAWLDGRLTSPVVLDMAVGMTHVDFWADEYKHTGIRALVHHINQTVQLDVTTRFGIVRDGSARWVPVIRRKRAEEIGILLAETFVALLPENAVVPSRDPEEIIGKIEHILTGPDGFSEDFYGTPLIVANAWILARNFRVVQLCDRDKYSSLTRPFLRAAFGTKIAEK